MNFTTWAAEHHDRIAEVRQQLADMVAFQIKTSTDDGQDIDLDAITPQLVDSMIEDDHEIIKNCQDEWDVAWNLVVVSVLRIDDAELAAFTTLVKQLVAHNVNNPEADDPSLIEDAPFVLEMEYQRVSPEGDIEPMTVPQSYHPTALSAQADMVGLTMEYMDPDHTNTITKQDENTYRITDGKNALILRVRHRLEQPIDNA